MPTPGPGVGAYGEGGTVLMVPSGLTAQLACAGDLSTFVDISSVIDRESIRIEYSGDKMVSTASFDIHAPSGLINGSSYTIQDWQEIRMWNPTTSEESTAGGGYIRYFGGYTDVITSGTDYGQTKVLRVRCVGYEKRFSFGPKAITTQYPAGDGTPVILQTITGGVTPTVTPPTSVVFNVPDPANLYVGKDVVAANADGSNREIVTITAIGAATGSGTPVTASFGSNKSTGWTFFGGISDFDLLAGGWYQSDQAGITIPTAAAGGGASATVLCSDTTNMFIGQGTAPGASARVYCVNANGTNPEIVTLTAVVASTSFTAVFGTAKTAGWTAKPLAWYYGLYDQYLNNTTSTTVTAALTLTGSRTVTPASLSNIFVGRKLWVVNADGSNRELVAVSAVNTGAGTFTATFLYTKAANWIAYNAEYFDVTFVREVIQSLPHMKFENETLADAIERIKAQTDDRSFFQTTSSTTYATPGRRQVTVASTAGFATGVTVRCVNADGTNNEWVHIESVDSSTLYTATFRSPKSSAGGGWKTIRGVYPRSAVAPNPATLAATEWWATILYFDNYDPTIQATVSLTDTTVITESTQAHVTDYKRDWDGTRRHTRLHVFNPQTLARGTYTDTNMESLPSAGLGGVGRAIESKPVIDTDASVAFNPDALTRAQRLQQSFGKPRETVRIRTNNQISPNLFLGATTVTWGHSNEGGTPAVYAIPRAVLSFGSDGLCTYELELGDHYEQLGEKPVPTYGSGSNRDLIGPSAPRWNTSGTSPAWLLTNAYFGGYFPYADTYTQQVEWISGGEADLNHFLVEWNDGTRWRRDTTDKAVTSYRRDDLPRSTTIQWRVTAFDNSGNPSPPSTTVSYATPAYTAPPTPTIGTLTFTHMGEDYEDSLITWSISDPTSRIVRYVLSYIISGQGQSVFTNGIPSPLANHLGVRWDSTGTVAVQGIDASGNLSAISGSVSWTRTDTAPPPTDHLLNPNFLYPDPSTPTLPRFWTINTNVGSTGTMQIDTPTAANAIKGIKVLTVTCPAASKLTIQSMHVAMMNPSNTGNATAWQMSTALRYKVTGTPTVGSLRVQLAPFKSDATSMTVVQPSGCFVDFAVGTPNYDTTLSNNSVGIAAQTAYGDMQIVIDNTANLTTPITITFAAARLEPAVTPNTIGTIYGNILIANDGAGHKGSISNSPSVGSPTATHNPEGWDIEASPFYFAKTAGTIAAEINYFGGAGPITTFQTNQTSSGLKFQSGSDTFGNVSSLQVGGILSGRTGDILAKQTSGAGDASFLVDMAALVAPAPASTTATRNFFYVGVVHGTPTGTPANSWTGRAPMVVDDTNEFLYFYVNGAWKCCKLAPAGKVVVPTVDNTGHVITDNDDKVVWEYGT